jgi:hypothetical protein
MPDLTDADLSRLITLVVIHEGESSSMKRESVKRLEAAGLIAVSETEFLIGITTVTDSGRALVARMLAAGRENVSRYYSCSDEGEFEEHDTENEAKDAADEWLESALSDNLWSEGVDRIEYGRLIPIGRATCVERRAEPKDESDADDWAAWGINEFANYKILQVGEANK